MGLCPLIATGAMSGMRAMRDANRVFFRRYGFTTCLTVPLLALWNASPG